jgi:hypothetical protein
MKEVKKEQAPCHSLYKLYGSARRTGPGPPFEFAGKMSGGEEEKLRPPRTPERWEVLIDEEDRVEENTERENSDLEGAVKSYFAD